MRLNHVLDTLGNPTEMSDIGSVVKAMIEDIEREALGEIVQSKEARKSIGKRTAYMYRRHIRG